MLQHLKQFLSKKTFYKDLIFLTLIQSIYFIPLLVIGLDRVEDYQYNHFSASILQKNYFNPFIFFFDLLGPGTRIPLGYGFNYFFPTTIFIGNIKVFYFSTFFLGLYLQFNYLKKINDLFKLSNPYIICLLYAFNIEILWQVFVGDSLKTFISVSCFPLILYYLIKFLHLKTRYYFFKLILIIGYIIINTHEAYMLTNALGFLLIILFNKNYFFFKERYFYFGIIVFIFITAENFYRLAYEVSNFDEASRENQLILQVKHYFSGIVFFLKFFESTFNIDFPFLSKFSSFDNFWLPFGGIIFYFAFFEAFRLILLKNSKQIYFINYVFLILIVFSFLDLKNFFMSIISSPWLIRDLNNFFSVILFGSFIKSLSNIKIRKTIICLALIFTTLHVVSSISYQYNNLKSQKYNFFKINKDYQESDFFKTSKSLFNNNTEIGKSYLSEGVWNLIKERKSDIFLESNIFYFNDLIKLNIYPFNSEFKNAHKIQLRAPKDKMYSSLDPRYSEINNEAFLNLFNITYLIILKNEEKYFDQTKFELLSKIKSEENEIKIFKLKNSDRNIVLNSNSTEIEQIGCEKKEAVSCLMAKTNLFKIAQNSKIIRSGLNKYEIINESNDIQKIILPFLYDSSWKAVETKIKNIDNALMFVEVKPNSKIKIYYFDKKRFILKFISIMAFVITIIYLIRIKRLH